MMIEKKIKKYLLNQPEINFFRKNDSGSEYFTVGKSIIRLSNHVTVSNNKPDTLNIVVTGENFVVMYGNRVIIVNDYPAFKNFLKWHIQMCDCFKDIIQNGLAKPKRMVSAVYQTNPTATEVVSSTEESVIPYTRTSNTLRVYGRIFDLSLLREKQKDGIEKMLQDGSLPNAEKVENVINAYIRQIQ